MVIKKPILYHAAAHERCKSIITFLFAEWLKRFRQMLPLGTSTSSYHREKLVFNQPTGTTTDQFQLRRQSFLGCRSRIVE